MKLHLVLASNYAEAFVKARKSHGFTTAWFNANNKRALLSMKIE